MTSFLKALPRMVERHPATQKVLLGCGVAAFALYVGMDAIAALRYDGYSYTDQTISELSAIGAPTRSFWNPLGIAYSALVVAFGIGVWASTTRRQLQVVGILAAGVGMVGLVGWPFAPMHTREVLAAGGDTWTDTAHLVLGGVSSLLFLSSMAFGATAFGTRFRRYSIVTLLVVLAAGALTGLQAPRVSADEPTPWLGLIERVAVFSPMLWYAVLAIVMLMALRTSVPQRLDEPGAGRQELLGVT